MTAPVSAKPLAHRRFPVTLLAGIRPIDRVQVPSDILAGVTLAAVAIPAVMGYTKIAGTPVYTGLYTILIPTALFALFGSSRHLVVQADSATAAIMAAGLVGIATQGTPEYMGYAGILALLAGLFVLLARIIRLGFLADFLSRTVLIGFLTGVGFQVAIDQISGILGITGAQGTAIQKLIYDIQHIRETNIPTLILSLIVIGVVLGFRRVNRRIPGPLIAVVGAILVNSVFNLASYGISVLGPVPAGLPPIGIPSAPMDLAMLEQLAGIAFSMFIVILAQSAATSRAYATRHKETFDENTDLVGLSLANFGAGLSGAFVVNGSPTQTSVAENAGSRSQLAQLTNAAIVAVVLLFLTGPLAYLPNAVLAGIVFLVGIGLIDRKGMARIRRERPVEFWIAVVTAIIVVFVGVEEGILLAIVLSLLAHTRHGYRSRNVVVVQQEDHYKTVPLDHAQQILPGLVIYRFHHGMYYANSEQLAQEIREMATIGSVPVRWLCVDMAAVDDVDFTAAAVLREAIADLRKAGVRVVVATVGDEVLQELRVSGLLDALDPDAVYSDILSLREAYIASSSARSAASTEG